MRGCVVITCSFFTIASVQAATPLPPHVNAVGPQQPVIYFEQKGSTGAGGAAKVTTCKSLCPSPANSKTCRVEGDPDKDGEFVAHSWRTQNAVARYSEISGLAQDEGDICTLRLKVLRILRITTFDGNASTLININLDRDEGTRRVIVGKPGAVAIDPVKGVAALRASGYVDAGTARYAGYSCRLLRKTATGLVQEACLLDDKNAPPTVLGLPTQMMPLADSTMNPALPERRIYSETQRIDFNATAPATVFTPPANIKWKNAK
ncbi:MAG TPA: hypothetical protein VJU53_13335 [Burkholderiaceae bacterium]|nr:hypothetical protein [Burkholderiaceae bacterium]